jgi:hypothetical protein
MNNGKMIAAISGGLILLSAGAGLGMMRGDTRYLPQATKTLPAATITITPTITITIPPVCAGIPNSMMTDCRNLAARPAKWENSQGAQIYTPAGTALVKECREQYAGTELAICLR